MKKIFLTVLHILMAVGYVFAIIRYSRNGTALIKGQTSLCFVLIGLINLIFAVFAKTKLRFPLAMMTGLCISMAADVVITWNFIAGAGLFAMGHICYFAAYCVLKQFCKRDLIPIGTIFCGSAIILLIVPNFDSSGEFMKWVCIGYAGFISFMTGKAISNFLAVRNSITAMLAIGSVMFYFSDFMLMLDCFAGNPIFAHDLCLASYFPAQGLLAGAIGRFGFFDRDGWQLKNENERDSDVKF